MSHELKADSTSFALCHHHDPLQETLMLGFRSKSGPQEGDQMAGP